MDPTLCRLCGLPKLTLPEQQAYGVCADCFQLPGFVKLPPNTRALKPCRECGGRELVRALGLERGAISGYAYAAPLAVAFRQHVRHAVFGPPIDAQPDLEEPVGWLELLICRACGLVTWHALAPQSIPIGPEYATELLRVEDPAGPYR